MNDALVEKVRKLLSKTEASGCSQAEAESAFKLASKIMAEHNLSMADVDITGSEAPDAWADECGYEMTQWKLEHNLAYGIVEKFFFVKCYRDRDAGKYRLMFFGKPENVAVAKFTYSALLNAFDRLWSNYRILNRRPVGERRLFITGVAGGFKGKLEDERKAEEIERDILKGSKSGGTAIALANINAITEAKMREVHNNLKKSRPGFSAATGDQSTLQAGLAAGRSLNLNNAIGGSSGRRAIGG